MWLRSKELTPILSERNDVDRKYSQFRKVLGMQEYRLGNFQDAIASSSRCLELLGEPDASETKAWCLAILALSHSGQGNKEAAESYEEKFVELLDASLSSQQQSFWAITSEIRQVTATSAQTANTITEQ